MIFPESPCSQMTLGFCKAGDFNSSALDSPELLFGACVVPARVSS